MRAAHSYVSDPYISVFKAHVAGTHSRFVPPRRRAVSKFEQRVSAHSFPMISAKCETLAVHEPPPKKRKTGPCATPDQIALTLPGQKLQFEDERRDCTYCAYFTDLQDGVAHDIRKAAQGLKLVGNVAFAGHSIIEREIGEIKRGFLVLNWNGKSSNIYSQLKDRLQKLHVIIEGGTGGKLVWIRPMKPYLKKRLESTVALVYPPDGTFWVHPAHKGTKIKDEEKLEAMHDWVEDSRGDLLGTSEDYVPFAEWFSSSSGNTSMTIPSCNRHASVHLDNVSLRCAPHGTNTTRMWTHRKPKSLSRSISRSPPRSASR